LRRALSATRVLDRSRAGHDQQYPDAWVGRSDLPLSSHADVAAVVHVYYPELLDELMSHLAAIHVPFDLLVTYAMDQAPVLETAGLSHLRGRAILAVENRGRDLWPLAQLVNAGLLDRYSVVLKVHTKRSGWRDGHELLGGSGDTWRATLLEGLLGAPTDVAEILGAFGTSADLGMVTADGSVLGPDFWGRDLSMAADLLARLDLPLRQEALVFAAGSMYWVRASILRRLRDLRLISSDFQPERGQVDGTMAHALERVIGLLCLDAGMRIVERSTLRPATEPGP
jgi:lipopolysaccharide biosynthesis protein